MEKSYRNNCEDIYNVNEVIIRIALIIYEKENEQVLVTLDIQVP